MTTKLIYILAAATLTFASAGAGSRQATSTGKKIQVVYREQASGEWQMFVFGVHCPAEQNMQAEPAALAQGKAARR